MRIIDPHVHVWKNDPRFPWAPETTNPPTEDATPEMLLQLMADNGVENPKGNVRQTCPAGIPGQGEANFPGQKVYFQPTQDQAHLPAAAGVD